MSIASQNWDGVTPPTNPAGWNYSTGNLTTTTTLPGASTPISTPNVLQLSAASNADQFATYATQDGNSGNVIVSAYFMAGSASNNCAGGLTARASANAVVKASSTFYYFWANFTTFSSGVSLLSYVSGSPTVLASVNFPATTEIWYQLFLTCQGTAISGAVYAVSANEWLAPSGSFQSGQISAVSVSDSSVTGQGYSGLGMISHTDIAYTDSWLLSAPAVVTPSPPPVIVRIPYQFYPAYAE